jgi:DnaJ homolog subfamily C member 7
MSIKFQVAHWMDCCLSISVASTEFRLRKAQALAHCGEFHEGEQLANRVVSLDGRNAEALFLQGLCYYYQDKLDMAMQNFQKVLMYAPDLEKAKVAYRKCKLLRQTKEDGNELFRQGRYEEARAKYTEALAVDPLNKALSAKLYFNRAITNSKLEQLEEIIYDCTKALELAPKYLKALLRYFFISGIFCRLEYSISILKL